jgi:DNA polymerase-3 subunit epsilon
MFDNLKLSNPLAVLDLETTGTDYARDRIVEIALVVLYPDGSVKEWNDLVNPGISIPKASSDIHGITDEMVRNCPPFREIGPKYVNALENCDLCGFNSNRFDFPFLVEEFLRNDCVFSSEGRRFIDVQRIYHKMEPRNLQAAYRFYCNKELTNAHSALADARATMEVLNSQIVRYTELRSDAQQLHNISKDGDFVDIGRNMYFDQDGTEKFNFGKHKGKSVREIFKSEPQYYEWIMRSDFPLDFKQKIKSIKEKI